MEFSTGMRETCGDGSTSYTSATRPRQEAIHAEA
jgi:hypothetical protein